MSPSGEKQTETGVWLTDTNGDNHISPLSPSSYFPPHIYMHVSFTRVRVLYVVDLRRKKREKKESTSPHA